MAEGVRTYIPPTPISGDDMDESVFKAEAQLIVSRNVSERIERALASFDLKSRVLRLVYVTNVEPTDEDWDDCELACGELIAAFPNIEKAETDCVPRDKYQPSFAGDVVFSRG